MSILAVGSIAFDSIATPSGRVENILGGSATYFSLAASYFTQVRVVAVVGEDFTAEHENVMKKRGVDTHGIEHAKGKTFRWGGQYLENLNEAKTDFTELNVFEKFHPRIPAEYNNSKFLFLGNIHPSLQSAVRKEMSVRLTGGDTMNFWIQGSRNELMETLKLVNVLLINDGEAKMLAGEKSLPRAAQKVLAMGPQALVIKHGEYGATVFFREGAFGIGHHPFRAPALPIDEVKDPTGAGDSFRWRIHGIHRFAGAVDPRGLQAGVVLWRRDGIVRRGALWHGAVAIAHPRGNRSPLSSLPRTYPPRMSGEAKPHWDQESVLVAWLAACVSLFSFLFYLRHGDVLLYGDAVAHINIARRVFDSRTPGLLQLGTVWLPLPHLLMIPFLLFDGMWQNGVGGSIPSMLAYVFSVVGIFRLVRDALSRDDRAECHHQDGSLGAALIYAANPNLIYLQSTAMTESLYLAWFIWAVVYFNDFVAHRHEGPLLNADCVLPARVSHDMTGGFWQR